MVFTATALACQREHSSSALFCMLALLSAPWSLLSVPTPMLAPTSGRRCLSSICAVQKDPSLFAEASAQVHVAAAAFGPLHEQAALAYTSRVERDGLPAKSLLDCQVALFEQNVEAYDSLLRAMNALQRVLAERRALEVDGSSVIGGIYRVVSGLDAKLDALVAEVRQEAAVFGARHARAAVEWTDRLLASREAASGNAVAAVSNAALLEQRVPLFEECQVPAGQAPVGLVATARCEALDLSLKEFQSVQERLTIAAARSKVPAGLVWPSDDPRVPPRLAEWGCDERTWASVKNKRALVRLANTAGGEARCRLRIANLKQVIDEEERARRAALRADRRIARTGQSATGVNPVRATWIDSGGAFSNGSVLRSTNRSNGRGQPRRQEPRSPPTNTPQRQQQSAWQTDEHRQTIPPELVEWGCDAELWAKVKKKNALRRLAKLGDEEHGRRRIAALRETLLP